MCSAPLSCVNILDCVLAGGRHDVIAARRAVVNPFCVMLLLHFCTFLLKPHFDLEPDYIVRKPIKLRFQQYLVHTEILSTFHTRVEYISWRTIRHSAHSKTELSAHRHTRRHTKVKTVYLPVLLRSLGRYNYVIITGCVYVRKPYTQYPCITVVKK